MQRSVGRSSLLSVVVGLSAHAVLGQPAERPPLAKSSVPQGFSEAIEALARACERGVDVRVMTPASHASDLPIVQHAAHRNFSKLLGAGVTLLEYQPTLLHQKMMTVDGEWCVIGSANFDERSLDINDELAVAFRDRELAARFEEIFRTDAEHCVALDAQCWAARGLMHKLIDHSLYRLRYEL